MRKENLNIPVVVCVFMMTLAGSAGAVTHTVDPNGSADFTGIQAAIDDANDGDEIEVSPGMYYEAVNFSGKAIRLYSSGGPEITIIDANGAYHVVQCVSGEDANTIFEGFTITGGNANGPFPHNMGGGMRCESGSPTVTNCTFTNNSASQNGGGMYNITNSSPTVTNCTFTDNSASWGGGICNFNSSPTVTNCTFSNNKADDYGGGMANGNNSPTVTNCTFSSNTASTAGGGIFNSYSSPTVINCILWGDTPNEIFDDIDSSTFVNYSVVQGGWSGGPPPGNIDADPLFVDAAGGDLRLSSDMSPCIDAGNNNASNLPSVDLAGNPRIVDGDWNGTAIVDMGAYEFQTWLIHNTTQDIWYETIRAAIDDAINGDQIEVAPGTYYEAIDFNGKSIRLYSSDGPQVTTINGDGAYHVVQCVSGEDADTILEGFTITGGDANGIDARNQGGGMYNRDSSPSVTNCIFRGNKAGYGGGMLNDSSSPTITDCKFIDNTATDFGGGMENYNGGSPTVTNCFFSGNTAEDGGGIMNNGCSPTVTNCTFSGNTAEDGGGMYNLDNSNPTVAKCTFSNNTANYGGGMYNYDYSSPTLTNCTFSGNSAYDGGGMKNYFSSSPSVTNCTFTGNSASYGGGMYSSASSPTVTNCTFTANIASSDMIEAHGGGMCNSGSGTTVTNCILWNDTPEEIYNHYGGTTVTYSDVQGSYSGTGNIDADPCFVDVSNPDPNVWNLRLQPDSPCIDAGDTTTVPGGTWADLGGNPRVLDDPQTTDTGVSLSGLTVDMGAYEFYCSGITGDNNCDGVVDFKDLAILCNNWLAGTEP